MLNILNQIYTNIITGCGDVPYHPQHKPDAASFQLFAVSPNMYVLCIIYIYIYIYIYALIYNLYNALCYLLYSGNSKGRVINRTALPSDH